MGLKTRCVIKRNSRTTASRPHSFNLLLNLGKTIVPSIMLRGDRSGI